VELHEAMWNRTAQRGITRIYVDHLSCTSTAKKTREKDHAMNQATATELVRLLTQAETMSWEMMGASDAAAELWDTIQKAKILVSGQVKGRDCENPECSETVVISSTGRPAKYCSDPCRFRAAHLRRR
jgi:hypothetical protein